MVGLKVLCLLVLAFCVMGLNVQDSHQYPGRSKSKIFRTSGQTLSLPVLSSTEVWGNFPELGGDVFVPYDQTVIISYSTQLSTTKAAYFCTRLFINGVEDDRFRSTTPVADVHNNAASLPVKLSRGVHKVQLQYRSGSVQNFPMYDWANAFLEVTFLDV